MTKKKSLITLLLSLCLIVPAMFVFNACSCSHTHKSSEEWSTDASAHWHVCTEGECTELLDKGEHTFTNKHDETNHWEECSECGYKKNEVAHSFTNGQLNIDTHTLECDDCGYETSLQYHTYDSDTDLECNVCQRERSQLSLVLIPAFNNDSTKREKEYDGQPYHFDKDLLVVLNSGSVDNTFDKDNVIVEYKDSKVAGAEWTTDAPTEVGSYYIRFRIEATPAYTSAIKDNVTRHVKINKKFLDLSNLNMVNDYATMNQQTDTWRKTFTSEDLSGLVEGDSITLGFAKKSTLSFSSGVDVDIISAQTPGDNNIAVTILHGVAKYTLNSSTTGKLLIANRLNLTETDSQRSYLSTNLTVNSGRPVYYSANVARTAPAVTGTAVASNYYIEFGGDKNMQILDVFTYDSNISNVEIAPDGTLLVYGSSLSPVIFFKVAYTGENESASNVTLKLTEYRNMTRTIADADAWENALTFAQGGYQVVLKKNGNILEDCRYNNTSSNYYKNYYGIETYYTIEDNKYYQYTNDSGIWVRNNMTSYYGDADEAKADFLDTIKLSTNWLENLTTAEAFATFTYSYEDLMYHTETSYTLGDSVVTTHIALKFLDGKLIYAEFTNGTDNYSIKVINNSSSDYVNMTIPSEYVDGASKEKAMPVTFNGNGECSLSGINLTANEMYYVVFEITDEMIATYGTNNKCELSGTFTVSGSSNETLEILVEYENGLEGPTNSGSRNQLYLEDLGRDKYYIKIKATTNCSCSLNMTVAV